MRASYLAALTLTLGLAPFARAGAQAPTDELRPSDLNAQAQLGFAVAADAGTFVAGAPSADSSVSLSGAVYVFVRSGIAWTQQVKLAASDAATNDFFGGAVAVEDETLVVGAPLGGSGAAYVFTRSGTSWTERIKLTAIGGAPNSQFGAAVALSGDTLAVGAPYHNNPNGNLAGSVHVFVRNGTTWAPQAVLLRAQGAPVDFVGVSLALEGDTLVAGAPGVGIGAALVFQRGGSAWAQVAELVPNDPTGLGSFAGRVALDGERLAVGARGPADTTGAVFVFTRQAGSWTEEARLVPSDAGSGSLYCSSLALAGDTLVASGPHDAGQALRGGAAWVFRRDPAAGWMTTRKLVQATPDAEALLGHAVAIAGGTVVCGVPRDGGAATNGGAIYTFDAPYPSFCDAGDGAHALCPCGPGVSFAGCSIAQSAAGVALDVLTQETNPRNRATLLGTGFPPADAPPVVVVRAAALESGPLVFGDGLRCVGTPLVRLAATLASSGASAHAIGHGPTAGPGDFHYQLWFRDDPLTYCDPTAAFNLSNGRTVAW